jgi:hypothetical protein
MSRQLPQLDTAIIARLEDQVLQFKRMADKFGAALGKVAAACVDNDCAEAYRWAYDALVDHSLSAEQQSEQMERFIDEARGDMPEDDKWRSAEAEALETLATPASPIEQFRKAISDYGNAHGFVFDPGTEPREYNSGIYKWHKFCFAVRQVRQPVSGTAIVSGKRVENTSLPGPEFPANAKSIRISYSNDACVAPPDQTTSSAYAIEQVENGFHLTLCEMAPSGSVYWCIIE